MVYKDFIQKITDALKRKHYTLKDVADYAGIDVSYLSRILSGKRNPPHKEDVIRRIAKCLEIDEDELIFLAGKVPQKYQQYFCDISNVTKLVEYLRGKILQKEKPSTEQQITKDKLQQVNYEPKTLPTPDELL